MNTTPAPSAAGAAPSQPAPIFSARDRITVATPCYDFSLTEYYHNSMRACTAEPLAQFRQRDGSVRVDSIVAGRIALPNDSHVDRARQVIANLWMEANETDWLLWIDADIEFAPEHIHRMFLHAQHGHKFVCGLYAMKQLTPTFVANVKKGATVDPLTGLIEVLHGGTGFMMIHRSVFEALQKHPRCQPYRCAPNSPWAGKKHYAYFSSGVYGAQDPATGLADWLSEDWAICQYWQDLGGKVLADTHIKLRHLGRMLYPPTVAEIEDALLALLRHRHPALRLDKLREAIATCEPPAPVTPFPAAALPALPKAA